MTAGGIETFVSVLEGRVLEDYDFKEDNYVYADDMDERSLAIAEQLMRKGVLNRELDESTDRLYFYRNVIRGMK